MKKHETVDFSRLSQAKLAEVFAISVRQIRTWTSWGLPRNPDGSYRLATAIRWYAKNAATHGEVVLRPGSRTVAA